jgi:hypothetical protein
VVLIVVVVLLFIGGVGAYVYSKHNSLGKNNSSSYQLCSNKQCVTVSGKSSTKCSGNTCIIDPKSIKTASGDLIITEDDSGRSTPFSFGVNPGQTIKSPWFNIKYIGVSYNATVTGDQPDPGTEYMKLDFDVTELPNNSNGDEGLYFSNDDTGGGAPNTIDGEDATYIVNPASGNSERPKKVSIPGEVSINKAFGAPDLHIGSDLVPDQVNIGKTIRVYTLFEIKKGAKGSILLTHQNKFFLFKT